MRRPLALTRLFASRAPAGVDPNPPESPSSGGEEAKDTVAALGALLKGHGFRKRGSVFNRTLPDGVVHVVALQKGAFMPPGTVEVPGLRFDLYGCATVNLGVWIPGIPRDMQPTPGWVTHMYCDLTERIGSVMTPERPTDVWWSLANPASTGEIVSAVRDFGVPWLDRFSGVDAILGAFETEGPEAIGMAPRGRLDVAAIYAGRGQIHDQRRLLVAHLEREHNPGHAEYLQAHLIALGFDDLLHLVRAAPWVEEIQEGEFELPTPPEVRGR